MFVSLFWRLSDLGPRRQPPLLPHEPSFSCCTDFFFFFSLLFFPRFCCLHIFLRAYSLVIHCQKNCTYLNRRSTGQSLGGGYLEDPPAARTGTISRHFEDPLILGRVRFEEILMAFASQSSTDQHHRSIFSVLSRTST